MISRKSTEFFPSIVCVQRRCPIWMYKFNITTRHWIISLSLKYRKIFVSTLWPLCATTSGHRPWTEHEWSLAGEAEISVLGASKRRTNAEQKGGRVAGSWRVLLRGGCLLAVQLHTSCEGLCEGRWALPRVLWGTELFLSTNKGLQSLPQTEYVFSSSVQSFPPMVYSCSCLSLSLLFSLAEHRIKHLWSRLFPDAISKFLISSFFRLFKQRKAHMVCPTIPPSNIYWKPMESTFSQTSSLLHPLT